MTNTLLLCRLKHHPHNFHDYNQSKRAFHAYLKQLEASSDIASRAAFALDNHQGDFDLRFASAESKLFEIFSEHYTNEGKRRPHLFGNIMHESRSLMAELYFKAIDQASKSVINDAFSTNFCEDFLRSTKEKSKLYSDVMEAMNADLQKPNATNKDSTVTSSQVQDVIREYFLEKRLPLLNVQVQLIERKASAELLLAFKKYYRERLHLQRQHLDHHIGTLKSEPCMQVSEQPKNHRKVKFNPLIRVCIHQDAQTFSARVFRQKALFRRGHSCIFGGQLEQHPNSRHTPLKRFDTFPE